ncbi:ribonucleoprotein PTB-binding 2 [Genypterus blacodes]|uniref:ribonucleoprotein PTB-binding 2 n=1 Tax=Genypterus blacodes TaxID=154954 RepID=UPI003F777731
MAAASSIPPPSVHSSLTRESALSPEMDSPESRQPEDEEVAAVQPPEPGTSLRDLPELEPEEVERRLAKTRQELSNRRKILMKNLPPDTTNQEVHEILKEYELKYCFVDRNKGTAFVTLLNGDQAQDAIRSLHHSTVRGRLINVTLQPTDSLLCLTNLAHTFTAQQFEELVRAYGNIERSFLVYSELTGQSKGYGFVEYMKKDSASRARSELLGRPLADRSVMVQWMDVNQLTQEENLHSKCLCVDRLPLDFCDSEELTQLFSETYKPVFCQLAQDEGSAVRGFGVVEYESSEQAEAVLIEMDRTPVGGQEIRLSLCTPGTSGRSTLAALIAAQGMIMSNRKGLLPEPNLAQLLTSMTNPAALQILMRPYHTGKRGGKYGRHGSLPFLRPPLTTALLTLGKAHQSAMLGNGLVLQNLLHMQLAQQQLLHIKDKRISTISGLIGDPNRLLMHKTLSLRPPGMVPLGKGLLGDSPTELGQESVPVSTHNATVVVSASGVMPYLQGRTAGGDQISGRSVSTTPAASSSSVSVPCDRQPAPPGTLVSSQPQGQSYSLGMSSSGLGPPPPKPPGGLYTSAGQHNSSDCYPPATLIGQSSLLGEPPKEVRLPSNPYLNLASVMPGMVLQGSVGTKGQAGPPVPGVYGSPVAPIVSQGPGSYSHSAPATTTAPYSTDTSTDYSQYNQAYTQEAMQQWYQHYQAAQAHTYTTAAPQESTATDYSKEHPQAAPVTSYGDYSSYMQAVTQYYTQPATATQTYATKEVDVCKPLGVSLHAVSNGAAPPQAVLPAAAVLPAYSALPLMPGFLGAPHQAAATPSPVAHTAATDWSAYYYNQARGHKREYPQLAVQEVTSSEGAYIGQHSQGLGGQYADYFKRKRL